MDSFSKLQKTNLLAAIKKGATYRLASKCARIGDKTLDKFIRQTELRIKNNEEEDDDISFYWELQEAEGKAAKYWLDLIDIASNNGNWQAAAWKLERRYPDEYGRNTANKEEKAGKESDDVAVAERIIRITTLLDEARARTNSK